MLSPTRFRFLNAEHEIPAPTDWNSPSLPKLWLYNLHYFDDLNDESSASRKKWHRELIARWMAENPPGEGTGWEPYPLSLRVINWIKWALAGNVLDEAAHQSLAVQVHFLTGRLERHLMGNHLFANAKALVFVGCYFEGDEAAGWLRLGMEIIEREIPEQILADGGHFERSTMYHALALDDMLDLTNLANAYPDALIPWKTTVSSWTGIINKMNGWLRAMCHPDGEVAFFNDAAIGIAPSPSALFAYAERLGLPLASADGEVIQLDPSGYIRISMGPAVLVIDAAPIGPDYLPGHAHADTLSYELSLFGQRVVVNSGTSRYGLGPEREWERSTAAHTTVEIDGQDSSEVWAGFRVARRAYPYDVSVKRERETVIVEAAHDGYRRLPGKPTHHRRWRLTSNEFVVEDWVEGRFHMALSRVYFHPEIHVAESGSLVVNAISSSEIHWSVEGDASLQASNWHPEFGRSVPNQVLEISLVPERAASRFALLWS